MATLKLTFQHGGRDWQITKHPRIASQARAGAITDAKVEAAPWYIRLDQVATSLETGNDAEAIRRAKARLKLRAKAPDKLTQFLAAEQAKAGITCGTLAKEWTDLRLPTPNGVPRPEGQISNAAPILRRALTYWANVAVASVTMPSLTAYATHRRTTCRSCGTGNRTIDGELTMLCNLCAWALAAGKIKSNPFKDRPRFQVQGSVTHCHNYAPENDQELHLLLRWFFANTPRRAVVGAQLLFSALSGLRPGEVGLLVAQAAHGEPGEVWTRTVDGVQSTMMRVERSKGGINPAVRVHPAMQDFLDTWRRWRATKFPEAKMLFPHPTLSEPFIITEGSFRGAAHRDLMRACKATGLHEIHAHGMRAYYVRTRRSQGLMDSQIGPELGHAGGSRLVSTTYGDPGDCHGSGRHDWLPEPGPPCWQALASECTNVVPFRASA